MKLLNQRSDQPRSLHIIFLTALLLFILISVYIVAYPENGFDHRVQRYLHPLAAQANLPVWTYITFFGSFEFLFPAYLILIVVLVWKKKPRYGLSVAGLALGGFLSVQLIKSVIQRHRPPDPLIPNVTDYSFPSGHSTSSLIFCAVLAYSLWHSSVSRSLRVYGVVLFFVLSLTVGLSRIVLMVHYPTDVVAGFCFGALWVIVWHRFVHRKI
jgi:undecaprenyl-diphosphatase